MKTVLTSARCKGIRLSRNLRDSADDVAWQDDGGQAESDGFDCA